VSNTPHMKVLIITLFSLLLSNSLLSQKIYTKDHVEIGERSMFIEACVNGAKETLINVNGIEIDTYSYCSCMSDNLIPAITSVELMDAAQNDKLAELITNDDNLKILMKCVENNFQINDDYIFQDTPLKDLSQTAAIKVCVTEIMSDPENLDFWTNEIATQYCECAITKVYSMGYTYKDILEIEMEDGESYNEIIVPCINDILAMYGIDNFSNTYTPSDISGSKANSSKVELIDYLGQGYKVKISINGVSKYYLFDTGASDLVINTEIELALIKNGALKDENYVGYNSYLMANNEEVEARVVVLDNVKIGDYTLNNVYVAIIDDGALLCGKGLLDKFKKWEVNKESKLLILYK